MYLRRIVLLFFLAWLYITMPTVGVGQEIAGVFGLSPIFEDAAFAIWVPLDEGDSISGISWFNNDGSKEFPEILAVAGRANYPSVMNNALVVGSNVYGETLGWSHLFFPTPLASTTSGLFVVFRLPHEGDFWREGNGVGIGYQMGTGEIRSWISIGEGEWGPVSPEFQMAVSPILNKNKSSKIHILGEKSVDPDISNDLTQDSGVVAGFSASPNPFNPTTVISFSLSCAGEVDLVVFDVRGRKIRTLVSGPLSRGDHQIEWDGCDARGTTMASSVYLCNLKTGPIDLTRRLTLLR